MSVASTPMVSIVIPAYQAEQFVGAAVSSALTQTYPRCEVVVTDDGSTDRTGAVVAAYGDLVRVVSQDNRGLPAARNAAIAAARGDLVCLLDADDILMPPHVEAAVQAWHAAGAGRRFVTCEATLMASSGLQPGRLVLPGGRPPADQQRRRILERNMVSVFGVFPRDMWEELGGFDESMRVCEDYDFWARAIYSGWRAVFQPVPHAVYRRSEGSLSTQKQRMYAGEQDVVRRLYEQHGGTMTPEERAYVLDRLATGSPQQAMDEGDAALRRGDVPTAVARYRDAARLVPTDRRLALKTRLLQRVPLAGRVYGRRLRTKDHETGLTAQPREGSAHE